LTFSLIYFKLPYIFKRFINNEKVEPK